MREADSVLDRQEFAQSGRFDVVAEDDMARLGDPGLCDDACFIGDRVVYFRSVDAGRPLSTLLHESAAGWPLIAYLVDRGWSGTVQRRELDPTVIESCVAAAHYVILGIFDAESFLILELDDPLR